jgi:hypothetical protein
MIRCNGGRSATLSATAAPGDEITATWQQWTHSQGPIIVWMYKCSGAFSACDGSGAGWFTIDKAGFHGDGKTVFLDTETGSGWDIAKLVGSNKSWTSKVPAGLAPGNYLIRHELIALHQANSPQFYPECAQLVVTGSGTAQPSSSQKVSIPGYCSDSDSNIRVCDLVLPSSSWCDHVLSLLLLLLRCPSTTTPSPRPTTSRDPPSSPALALPKSRRPL